MVVLRFACTVAFVAATTELLRYFHIQGHYRALISLLAVFICAWFGGIGPSLLLAPCFVVIERFHRVEAERWIAPTPRETWMIILLTALSASIGLAGSYHRRIRTVTRRNARVLGDQSRALDQAPIVFRELDGIVTKWSLGAERLLGWTATEAVGRSLHELLLTQFPFPLAAMERELVKTGQWQGEVVHRHKAGHELNVATCWILYRDDDGVPMGVAEVLSDVTDVRRAEAAVREADRRKEQFIAILAHELRNPLAPIRTGLEVLKTATPRTPQATETIIVMERQLRHLITLVDDLLDVSRITHGKLVLRKQRVSVADIIQSAVESAKPSLDVAGHELSIKLPEQPLYTEADPFRLTQVFCNLLDNAAKYTPEAGRISISIHAVDDAIKVSIKDTGLGIQTEMLNHIFDLFTRGHEVANAHSGLGIGLSLVKSITELHGGHVEVRSDGIGKGAEFSVWLPLKPEPIAATSGPQPAQCTPAAHGAAHRVMVVDDNRAAANLLGILIKQLGKEVRVAYDGVEAIEAAEQFEPDVVFLDLGMPRLDGYDAARHIRRQPWGSNLLLVALTGWGQEEDKRRVQQAGFDHHLIKPADPEAIRRLLAEADGTP